VPAARDGEKTGASPRPKGRALSRRERPPPGWRHRAVRAVPSAQALTPRGHWWRRPTPALPTPRTAGDLWSRRFPAAASVATRTLGCACGGGCGGSSALWAWRRRPAAAGILGGGHDRRGRRVNGRWVAAVALVDGGSDRPPRPQRAVGGHRCARGGRRRWPDRLCCDGHALAQVLDTQQGRAGWHGRPRRNAAAAARAAVAAVRRDAGPDGGVPKRAVGSPWSQRRRLVADTARGTGGQVLDPPRRWGWPAPPLGSTADAAAITTSVANGNKYWYSELPY